MNHKYGHRPPEISNAELSLGWLTGIRRISRNSASSSTWHRHAETSVICCLKGEMTYEFHGLSPVTLTAGSFLTIPAHAEHRHLGAIDPIGERLELLLSPNPPISPRYKLILPRTVRKLHAKLLSLALQPTRFTGDTASALRILYTLSSTDPKCRADEELGLIRVLCHRLLYDFAAPITPSEKKADPGVINGIVDWFEEHFSEKIDIDRIVAHIGYSRTHVFTLFKRQFGLSPVDYLTRLRIRKAQAMLRSTDLTTGAIATRCGFTAKGGFAQAFRRLVGTSPSQYRARRLSAGDPA